MLHEIVLGLLHLFEMNENVMFNLGHEEPVSNTQYMCGVITEMMNR